MPYPKDTTPKEKNYKIKVTRDGHYLVSGGVPLSEQIIQVDTDKECHGWIEGQNFPIQENYALCRCGNSKNKPFCDGSHLRIAFNGTESSSFKLYLEQAREIRGASLKLTDAEDFCASARFCHRAGGTWRLTRQSAVKEARQKAIEEACDCPSGRLVVWDENDKPIEPDFEPSIGLVKDTQANKMGPIWVRGGILIESSEGKTYEIRNRVTLCRCGRSSNKPFCDGSHLEQSMRR